MGRAPGPTAASGNSTLLPKECPCSKVPGVLSIILPKFRKQRNQGQRRGWRGEAVLRSHPRRPTGLREFTIPDCSRTALTLLPYHPHSGLAAKCSSPLRCFGSTRPPSMTDQPPCLPGNSQDPQTCHDLQKSTHSCVRLLKCC